MDKISYEKPTAVDLGPAAPVVGASCVPGRDVDRGQCELQGNSAGWDCKDGSSPSVYCEDGAGYLNNRTT